MVRVKERPEDFFVRELKKLRFTRRGRYAYFLLRKRNMTTLDALRRVADVLGVDVEKIGCAGFKDRKALTEQYISVEGVKNPRSFEEENLSLTFLGFGEEPVRTGELEGNYFELTIRGVRAGASRLEERLAFVRRFGFENYFGEQRFGSVKHAEDFVLRYLIRGDYEGALREYLTSMGDRKLRRMLLENWGRWREFLRLMPQKSEAERGAVEVLLRGGSFRDAFLSLPRSVRLMFSFAYQSYLWNRYLNTFIVRYFRYCSVPFLRGRLSFTTEMNEKIFEEIRDLEIPFLGIEFEPANRKFPENLKLLEKGRGYVKLSFTLPAGSYATVLLRKILCSPLKG